MYEDELTKVVYVSTYIIYMIQDSSTIPDVSQKINTTSVSLDLFNPTVNKKEGHIIL